MDIIKEIYKVFPDNKVKNIKDILPKNPKYREQAMYLEEQLNKKGFICEIVLDDYLFRVCKESFAVDLNSDAVRVFDKGDKFLFMGYDYLDGVVRFEFLIDKTGEIDFNLDEKYEVKKESSKSFAIKLYIV